MLQQFPFLVILQISNPLYWSAGLAKKLVGGNDYISE